MSFEIVTDSAANLPEEMIEQYGIHVLSLSFFVDDKEYYSYEPGKKTDLSSFYEMMRQKKEIRTSLVNLEQAKQMMEQLAGEGKDVLYVGFSSALSGTFQAVNLAMEEVQEQYPERKMLAVDTLAAALGEGYLVRMAVEKRDSGMEIEKVQQWILDQRLHMCHWFTVDDLFFLKRGGRISAATAVMGTALSVKPILHMDNNGCLVNVSKTRGRKKSLDALLEKYKQTAIDIGKLPVYISHGDCLEDAKYLEKRLREDYGVQEIVTQVLDPVIGAHAGPGTAALLFLGTER